MRTNKKAPVFADLGKKTRVAALITAFAVLGMSTACAPRVDTRGNAVPMEEVATIEPGTHTRDHVINKLGSPSNVTAFGDDTWYYISEITETTAFLAPEIVNRQVVVVKFDEHGVVQAVDVVDEQSAQKVEPVDRKTPTAGNTLNVFEQLISNLGRFNKK